MTVARKMMGQLNRIVVAPGQEIAGGFAKCTRKTAPIVLAANIRRYDPFNQPPKAGTRSVSFRAGRVAYVIALHEAATKRQAFDGR